MGAPNDAAGNLSSIAVERCRQALLEYRAAPGFAILPTGGFGAHFNRGPEPHAQLTRRWLLVRGVPEQRVLEADLRGALRRGELGVHYQPIVEAQGGRLVGLEALVRWQHPQLGAVSPGEFIPLAEETGLVIELDRWVLGTACAQVAAWGVRYGGDLSVSVNLSSRQFGRADLIETVTAALGGSGLESARLKLELTEGVMLATTPAVARSLAGLRGLGVGLASDDFGTGYSSLAYLQRLSADQLKIDRAFTGKLGSAGGTELVRTVVAVAHPSGCRSSPRGPRPGNSSPNSATSPASLYRVTCCPDR